MRTFARRLRDFCYSFLAIRVAERIRRAAEAAEPGTFFHARDLEGSRPAVETALHRLAASGTLVRARKGLYWKGWNSRFGSGRPHPAEVALQVTGEAGVGPTGWTASNALGLSTQVPVIQDLVVTGRVPVPPRGIRLHSRANLARLELNFHEIGLLEVLRDWPYQVEVSWSGLVRRVREMRDEGLVDIERVQRCASREPPAARRLVAALVEEATRG
jgi:uncharacterized protein DUF6088